jgi:Flp pilus assembly protein TadB
MSYALKLAAIGLVFVVVGVIGIAVFGALWARIGIGAAIVIVVGGLLFFAWRQDQKAREARAGLERI